MNSSRPTRFHPRTLLLFGAGLLILALGSTAAVAGVWRAPTAPSAITAFSYQGYLQDNGDPANGPFDFEFKLFDAPAGGSQLGSTATLDDVTVLDGLFTVTLDFGVLIVTLSAVPDSTSSFTG